MDAYNQERFDEAKSAMEKVLGSRELSGAPLLVLANKIDIAGALDAACVADHFGLGKIGSTQSRVVAVCSHTGEGVREAIDWLIDAIKKSGRISVVRNKAV